ncbi:hypothetical protein [Blastococcus sp. CT_GayMR16]|uniref:hypothetical protein n=1 Tax=Blastococcus sp. CT_GayMR16 TaxID=2559607 RepID=UPI0010738361|nr:hypothetical protein [Blastococcus sp. CT_GayMR16]TFV83158.1 hypothetical protein E4P38_21110 [Blastococcus sp. CT_GayMR16]
MARVRSTWRTGEVMAAIEARVRRNADDVGEMLAGRIRSRAPRSSGGGNLPGGGHAADTATRKVTSLPDIVRLTVGFPPEAWYMGLIEDGTSRIAAQPSVRPAVLESKADIVRGMAVG